MSETQRLLIIDDDPDFVAAIKATLERGGYAVDAAYDPKSGFDRLEKSEYDLLLLDIMMGRGAEGLMIARKLRKDPKLSQMPVLIITGLREQISFLFPGEAVHPHFLPIDELVEKPLEPQFLLDRVAALLKLAEDKKAKKA